MFKLLLAILLFVSLGLNAWQRWDTQQIIALQAAAIEADKAYWVKVNKTPVLLWKVRETGDLFVGVPYRELPFKFPKVCMQERKL